jgi:Relaxase/Mobilisation nuclease domain
VIPFASQRGGGQDLATHLLNAYDNEIVEVAQVRGAIASDLHGAFKEWEVQADTLTRCEKYLYSLSINPDQRQGRLTRDQYMDYIDRAEKALGLNDQPRAVVFHVKDGREHCHVAWSRINVEQQRAVHIAFDHDKLMCVTRSFARDHGINLPKGYEKSRQVGQITQYEQAQLRQTGISKADHMRQVTEAWQQSDDARAFVQALAERGYLLATGKKPYVLVDLYGNVNTLPKLIDDKTVRTADIRAFLAPDFPVESLPTVEEAEQLVAEHRKVVERSLSEDRYADKLAALQQGQQERRAAIERASSRLAVRQKQLRDSQQQEHRAQRDAVRHSYRQTAREVRAMRDRDRPTGLAAFLGKVCGIDLVRKAVHRHQDTQRLKTYRAETRDIKVQQQQEARALEVRLKLQSQDMTRKEAALTRVERRELSAFMRDQRTDQRVRDRGEDGAMPSLVHIAGLDDATEAERDRDLLSAFEIARVGRQQEAPDLLAAFSRAARSRDETDTDDGSGSALDRARPTCRAVMVLAMGGSGRP